MSAPPLDGEDLLEAVTASMVAFHERYHHRKPVHARTRLLGGDLLACVLGGVYTAVEQTLIEMQRAPLVNTSRAAFRDAMQEQLVGEVERLTGRKVIGCFSQNHVGPDVEVNLFLLAES